MKKFLTVLFALILVCFFTACGEKTPVPSSDTDSTGETEPTQTEQTEPPVHTEVIYVHSGIGNDEAEGNSPDTPLKTLPCAIQKLKEIGGQIVIMDAYAISSELTEPIHTAPITITTNDGDTDYGKDGAMLAFGNALRYQLGGDTTFENIQINFSGTLNFVANYNYITFGQNVITENTSSGNGIYVIGGYQSPANDVDVSRNSHITIQSGTFYAVAGGSRQVASGAKNMTFTGTHYIDISGGTVSKVYGGSLERQYSNNANITVSGGTVKQLFTGGDATRRLNGNATVTLSGGAVDQLNINNVVGAANVHLTGTTVKNVSISYANAEITELAKKSGAIKTLYYNALFYEPAFIESIGSKFDAATNSTKIYAKEGAAGTGATETDPASFADAFAKAAKMGGEIAIIDTLEIKNFTEPAHSDKILIKGAAKESSLLIGGVYTLGGETAFEKITLNADKSTLNAEGGSLTIKESVTMSGKADVIGSAVLQSGTFGIVNGGNSDAVIVINGANADTVIGGTASADIEITDGAVGTLKTTEDAIRRFRLNISGGSVQKLEFNNVSEHLEIILYGGKIASYAVNGSNVQGTAKLNEAFYKLADLGAAASLFTVNNEQVVYLMNGGTGNGTAPTMPFGNLKDAYAALPSGGVIVICGPYTLGNVLNNLQNTSKITITSVYGDTDYAKTNNANFQFSADFYCGGETEFRDITLICAKRYCSLYANGNKLTLGDNIISEQHSSVNTYLSVMGGGTPGLSSTDLTINSGKWQRVRGGNASDAANMAVNLTVNGGEFVEPVTLGSGAAHSGDIHAEINGGIFYQGIFASTLEATNLSVNSNVTLTINGGTVYGTIAPARKKLGTYTGSYTVSINGGEFSHLTDLTGTEGMSGTMTSSLHVGVGIDINAKETGTMSFTNPIRSNGADPWLFYHDGNYYYIATAGSQLTLYKAANIGDLPYAAGQMIYKPEAGKPWSKNLWSPEIHYFGPEDFGEEYAGWYCFIACDDGDNTNHRMYVIKCLTDDLMGAWGHPLTGEENVPIKVESPDVPELTSDTWAAGQTAIRIDGQLYTMWVGETGRGTSDFHQTINIAKLSNPWTITKSYGVICVPEYTWEKGGSQDGVHPQVVEGGTAVYGSDGSVYIVYSGSGYWTTEYKLGQLKYLGGDPLDIKNWEKLPTPILSKSNELNGCGHASYVTDTDGQGWICYHAYLGTDTSSGRYAFVEPYTADENGVVIGNGTKRPESPSKVYTVNVNPRPLAEKISNFGSIEK